MNYWNHIDWEATGAMLQGIGTVGGAIAVYAAAVTGFSAWRRQKLAERNRDQAEVILHAAYNARRALRYIRSPLMTAYELTAAKQKLDASNPQWRENMPEARQERQIVAQGYVTRLENSHGSRTKLEECLPMARALFGAELEKSVENLHRQFFMILSYSHAYVYESEQNDNDFSLKIRNALFNPDQDDEQEHNEISSRIKIAIGTIEKKCVPFLRLEVV